jgi:iron complex outermembrane receptor protein
LKLNRLAHALSLVCIVAPAVHAQETVKGERVEITGSNIKRIQTEGALPLQIITREQIDRAGIFSAEELMTFISANGNGVDNLASKTLIAGATDVENRNSTSNSSADLRGLGAGSTLVLLNGRRVALHSMKAAAVDLNSIPFAAVERVEILKDGASAIYGTDAIGGVINFILRKDYQGVEVSGTADLTQEGGANRYKASILAGFGDLSKDKFNVMATFAFDRAEVLYSKDRSFSNGFQPDRGLSPDTAGTPYATQTGAAGSAIGASFVLPGSTQAYTRANLLSFQNRCAEGGPMMSQYQSALWANPSARYACAYDYTAVRAMQQPLDSYNFVGRATMQLTPTIQGLAEFVAARTEATNIFEERQITTSTAAGTFLPAYPVNGPYYNDLSAFIPTFNRNLPIAYRWRCIECGPRQIEHITDEYRFLAALNGEYKNWDWKAGFTYGKSTADSTLVGGYFYSAPFRDLLATGKLNPWALPGVGQTPDAMAALNAARADGAKLVGGETTLTQFDASASGDIFQLPAGAMALAVGLDWHKETYEFIVTNSDGNVIGDVPSDTPQPKVDRTVTAFYAELAIPIAKGLETTLAVRHDRYSDFGNTTNPKVSLSWRPMSTLMFRGSWGEGFHAPTFVQLYGQTIEGPVPGNIADPVLCPAHPNDPVYCAIRPNARTGGNANLQPETSKQWNVGLVFEPVPWFNTTVDLWDIKREGLVTRLTPQEVVANYTQFPEYIVRNADGSINYIQAGLVNAANENVRGVDITARIDWQWLNGKWRAQMDGTYIDSYEARIFDTQAFQQLEGEWTRRTIYPTWKHVIGVSYTTGPWSGTFLQRYVSGYKDEKPAGTIPPGFEPYIDSYILYDLMVGYTGIKNLTLRGGVKNLLNTDPPFTAHATDFVSGAGWDPRVGDPRGRSFVLGATYKF